MSLKSELEKRESSIRQFIDVEFPHLGKLSRELNKNLRFLETIKPPSANGYRRDLVGAAIDYRIRLCFNILPQSCPVIRSGVEWIESFPRINKKKKTGELHEFPNIWFNLRGPGGLAETFFASFDDVFTKYYPCRLRLERDCEIELCRYCLICAAIDFTGRVPSSAAPDFLGQIGNREIKRMLDFFDIEIVEDVYNLSILFQKSFADVLATFSDARAGLGLSGSSDVYGADFDLVVDGCLVEIKAQEKARISTADLQQLVGYWLLDYDDAFNMRTAAIYLARQGHMQRFDIKLELLRANESLDAIRRRFREGVRRDRASRRYLPGTVRSWSAQSRGGFSETCEPNADQAILPWVVS